MAVQPKGAVFRERISIFRTSPGWAEVMWMGPWAGSARLKSKVGMEEVVEVAVIWLWPPSRREKVRVVPDGTVAMGGRELSHFRCRWVLLMWIVWDILGEMVGRGGGLRVCERERRRDLN